MLKFTAKRKGQLEIMGLVIIVILISLGMLFLVQFALQSPTESKKIYTRKQLASNTVNSIMLTTTECQGLDISELIKDFVTGYPQVECDGMDSQEYTDMVIKDILDQTLKEWGKSYEFTVMTANAPAWINITEGGCPGTKDSSTYFIPSRVGRVFVRLDVCG